MTRSSVMIDLDDPRTQKIADVMGNTTCKKMLSFLAERELSESELAKALNAPLNTINYNMKKLVAAGLVEPVRSLWSSKGRAVKVYRVSQKKIVISPRSLGKGILPAFLVTLVAALGLRWSMADAPAVLSQEGASSAMLMAQKSADVAMVARESVVQTVSYAWMWFLGGALLALAVLSIWNWFTRP